MENDDASGIDSAPGAVSLPWSDLWCPVSEDYLKGWVKTLTEAEQVRQCFEESTGLRFVGERRGKGFGMNDSLSTQFAGTAGVETPSNTGESRVDAVDFMLDSNVTTTSTSTKTSDHTDVPKLAFVRYKHGKFIPCDGVPFMIMGKYFLTCFLGRNKHKSSQQALREEKLQVDRLDRKRKKNHRSKKIGCPAMMVMTEVIRFPQYQVSQMTRSRMTDKTKLLREHLLQRAAIETEHRIYISLPSDDEHQNTHPLGQSLVECFPPKKQQRLTPVQQTAERCRAKIDSLVQLLDVCNNQRILRELEKQLDDMLVMMKQSIEFEKNTKERLNKGRAEKKRRKRKEQIDGVPVCLQSEECVNEIIIATSGISKELT
ncbi:uncharacterized protein LOC585433 [Strongylocentrotus purpuratus]|uniref:Uncharacterized protein n=1 Tax=Strongylocentrotus purpuratus TaxID=7668 RepID=A0A7M7RG19_STRPU|nr:uncharacterized protein LOC585433 [Strongylocentrotus purpuratus]